MNVIAQLHFYSKTKNYRKTFNLQIVQSTLCKSCSPSGVNPKVKRGKKNVALYVTTYLGALINSSK